MRLESRIFKLRRPSARKISAWKVSDDFWANLEPLIPVRKLGGGLHRGSPGVGRKPTDARKILSGILYIVRNGISWRASPSDYGSGATLNRYFKLWQRSGFFGKLRESGLGDYEELKDFPWARVEREEPPSPLGSESAPLALRPTFEVHERELSLSHPRVQSQLMRFHGVTDVSGFWTSLQSLFRETIPNNSMVAYLDYFDHPKSWMAARILTTANAHMSSEWLEKRWKLDITPPFLQLHPGIKFFQFSDIIADPREYQNTDYFRQFFKPFGWYYTGCLSFWHRAGVNSVIALRRTQAQGDYRPDEIELFRKLHPHIEVVLKRLLPIHKDQAKAHWLGEFARHIPLPFLLLDWDLEPFYVNCAALEQCAVWNFGPKKARAYDPRATFRTPSIIVRTCAELKELWHAENIAANGSGQPKASSRVSHSDFPGYNATVTLQNDSKDLIIKPSFLVYFDHPKAAAPEVDDSYNELALWRLTTAERDIARLALDGCNNREIAAQLHKSVNTVKHQLTSVYSKLGINGRGKRLRNSLGSGVQAAV
jgi:DNA-binding CsgD family transcriptional regulator/transposase